MPKRFEEVVTHCVSVRTADSSTRFDLEPLTTARIEQVWRWVLRLVLPLLVGFSGLAVYWLWFDSFGGEGRWLEIIVGLPLAGEIALVMLWAVGSWYFKDMT